MAEAELNLNPLDFPLATLSLRVIVKERKKHYAMMEFQIFKIPLYNPQTLSC